MYPNVTIFWDDNAWFHEEIWQSEKNKHPNGEADVNNWITYHRHNEIAVSTKWTYQKWKDG